MGRGALLFREATLRGSKGGLGVLNRNLGNVTYPSISTRKARVIEGYVILVCYTAKLLFMKVISDQQQVKSNIRGKEVAGDFTTVGRTLDVVAGEPHKE